MAHTHWWGMRRTEISLRHKPVDEGMSGVLGCVNVIYEFLVLVREASRDLDVRKPFLLCVSIAIFVVEMFRTGIILFLRTRVGRERGIIKGLLGMCMAELCGCRSERELRAHGTVRPLCLG